MIQRLRRAVVAAAAILALAAPVAVANQTDAQNLAQNHVQTPGCGDGTSWFCNNAYWWMQGCTWYSGGPFWSCWGESREYHWVVDNTCQWKVHVHDGKVLYWHDYCRDRTGSGWLG